jgi:hypothetical protein
MNRLNLFQELINIAKHEIQQAMSRLASTATMSDKEKQLQWKMGYLKQKIPYPC